MVLKSHKANICKSNFLPLLVFLHKFRPESFPKNDSRKSSFVAAIAISFLIRPTTAIFWLPMLLGHLHSIWKSGQNVVRVVLVELAPPALLALAAGVLVDSWFYRKLTFVPWNFLKFNLVSNFLKSVLAGTICCKKIHFKCSE
jgi:hypothetical protein